MTAVDTIRVQSGFLTILIESPLKKSRKIRRSTADGYIYICCQPLPKVDSWQDSYLHPFPITELMCLVLRFGCVLHFEIMSVEPEFALTDVEVVYGGACDV